MFLVSNTAIVKEGMKSGITGWIPALNYASEKRFSSHSMRGYVALAFA
jgi:hypothetical protein